MKIFKFVIGAFFILSVSAWSQFYTKLDSTERYELAESYYLAGLQYRASGAEIKGQEFINLAFKIEPTLQPEKINFNEMPSTEELFSRGPVPILTSNSSSALKEFIKSKFLRVAGAFLTENISGVMDGVAGSIMLTPGNTEITQDQLYSQFREIFKAEDLSGMPLSMIYDLNTLSVEQSKSYRPFLGETYQMSINARVDLKDSIDFWKLKQDFFISNLNSDLWLITAFGSTIPKADWQPDLSRSNSLIPREDLAGNLQVVRSTFLSLIDSFLKKDTLGMINYIAPEIDLLNQNTRIDRLSIEAAFRYYFDNSPYWGLRPDDIVTITQAEKIHDAEFSTYLVKVEFSPRALQTIPEWTVFKNFSFSLENSIWKIVSIS